MKQLGLLAEYSGYRKLYIFKIEDSCVKAIEENRLKEIGSVKGYGMDFTYHEEGNNV